MKTTNLYHLNMNVALRILLLLGFAAFFLYTIFTGSVSLYVHPRIIPFMIFAAAVMIIIAFLHFGLLFQQREKKFNSWPLFLFIIPLIMAFALPAEPFNSGTKAVREIELSGGVSTASQAENSSQNLSLQDTPEAEGLNTGTESAAAKENSAEGETLLKNGVLVMDNNNFYNCMSEVYDHLEEYEGTPIEVVGFVFKDNDKFAKNEFVPSRMMMVCCAADMVPVGFLCRYDKAAKLETDSWVKVTGTIRQTEFDGKVIPYIEAESVEKAQKPDDDYVYPY